MEAANSTPQKFSRYRSVREKNSKSDAHAAYEEPPPVPVHSQSPNEVKRAPSRYRRNGSRSNIQDAPALPSVPQARNQTGRNGTQKTFVLNYEDRVKREQVTLPHINAPNKPVESANTQDNALPAHATNSTRLRSTRTPSDPSTRSPTTPGSYKAAREEARMILEGEFDRMQKMKQTEASDAPNMRKPRNTARADHQRHLEQQVPIKTKPQKQVRSPSPPPPPPAIEPEPVNEKPPAQSSPSRNFRQFIIGGTGNGPPKHQRTESKPPEPVPLPQIDAPNLHKPDIRKPISPNLGYDAPVSAVNAGDRRVSIHYNDNAPITLPVTPSTTVKDLLNTASIVMSTPIDPKTAILHESFSQLGLERPLRRYERVRDVMNSWDNDTANHLFILPHSSTSTADLDLSSAPSRAPTTDLILQLHHSSRPGHWTKKYIRLRPDGQVSISTKENPTNHLVESTNICHLSDFDLYTPTPAQIKRHLKPPHKKICFAVKSQQKSAMFLNGENYAHFFCAARGEVGERWARGVWEWRCWYLVGVLGEGGAGAGVGVGGGAVGGKGHGKGFSLDVVGGGGGGLRSGNVKGKGHRDRDGRPGTSESTGTVPYQLGSFKPLLDFEDLRLGMDDAVAVGKSGGGVGGGGGGSGGGVNRSMSSRGNKSLDMGRRKASIDIKSTSPKRMGTAAATPPPSSFPRNHTHHHKLVLDAMNLDPAFEHNGVDEQAFTGKGLLARHASTTKEGQGAMGGRGVKGEVGKPLVDLKGKSEFKDGSLLRQLEAWRREEEDGDGRGMVGRIDREKRVEGNVKVGEGY